MQEKPGIKGLDANRPGEWRKPNSEQPQRKPASFSATLFLPYPPANPAYPVFPIAFLSIPLCGMRTASYFHRLK